MGHEPPGEPAPLLCSTKGCSAPAVWSVRWNNPRLHAPERRKTWLACDQHRSYLAGFLDRRGFLREVVPVDEPHPGAGEGGP